MYDLLKSKKTSWHGRNLKVTIYFKGKLLIKDTQVYDNNGELVVFMNIENKITTVPILKLCTHRDFQVYNN